MKNFIILCSLIFIVSCNNDDRSDSNTGVNTEISNSKVKTYSMRYAHDSATPTYAFTYLDNGNLNIFNYNNLTDYKLAYVNDYEIEYINDTTGNFPNGQPKIFVNYQLDSNKRITGIISGILSGHLYKLIFTYNSENYLVKIEEFKRSRSYDTGQLTTEYKITEINTLQWQNGNLTQWNEMTYNTDGSLYADNQTNFSEFLPENINTIGIKNYGFDYFGKGGIPEDIISYSNINFQVFAGKLMPGKSVKTSSLGGNAQIKSYTYSKDAKGRVLQCDISNEIEVAENKLFSYTN